MAIGDATVDTDEMLKELLTYLLAFISGGARAAKEIGADNAIAALTPRRAPTAERTRVERTTYQVLPDGSIVVDTAEQAIAISRHFSTGAPIAAAPIALPTPAPIAAAPIAAAPIAAAPIALPTPTPAPTPDRSPIAEPATKPPPAKPTAPVAHAPVFAQTTELLTEAKARRRKDIEALFAVVMKGHRTRAEIMKRIKGLSQTRYHHALNYLLGAKRVARLGGGKYAEIVPWDQRDTSTPSRAEETKGMHSSGGDAPLNANAERVRQEIAKGASRAFDIRIATGWSRHRIQSDLRTLLDRGIIERAGATNQTTYWIAGTPQPVTKASRQKTAEAAHNPALGPDLAEVRAAIAGGCTTTIDVVKMVGASKATVLRRIATLVDMGIVARTGILQSTRYALVERDDVAPTTAATPIADAPEAHEPIVEIGEVATLEDDSDGGDDAASGDGDDEDDIGEDHAPIATIGDDDADEGVPIAESSGEEVAAIAADVVLGLDGAPVEDEDNDEESTPDAALSDHEVRVRADCALIVAAIGRGFRTRAEIVKASGGLSSSRYFQALGRLTKEGNVRRDGNGPSARLSLVEKPDEIAISGADRMAPRAPETEVVVVADDGSDPLLTAILAGNHTFDKILAATGMARGVASYRLKALVKDKKVKRTDNGSNPRYYVERPKGSIAPLPPRAPAPAPTPRIAPKVDVQENEDAEAGVDDDGPIAGPKALVDEDEEDEDEAPKPKRGTGRARADETEAPGGEVMHFEIRRGNGTVIAKAANIVMGKQIMQRHADARTLVRTADGVVMARR